MLTPKLTVSVTGNREVGRCTQLGMSPGFEGKALPAYTSVWE